MIKRFAPFLFFFTGSFAQPINTGKLDSLLDIMNTRDLAMGSLVISKNKSIVYQRAIGYSYIDSTKKIPANSGTRYRIGSETKMFTAVMIFQLIEEGKLRLNQKLADFYPNLPNANNITIGNLLNHRSGLHNYTEGTNFPDWMDKSISQEQLLKIIKEKSPDFEPNTKSEYCNSNYLLLGYIIEKLTKTSYEKALKKRILTKIGLSNTYFGGADNYRKNETASYKNSDQTWKKEKSTNLSIHGGAGGMVSTPADMVKFIEALFDGKLISDSSLRNMETMVDGYGMGLFPFDHNDKTGFGHNGRIEEFYSTVQYYPNEQLTIAYITNGIIYPRHDLLEGILDICFEDPYILPYSTTIILYGKGLDKYIGEYSSDQMPISVTCTKNANVLQVETKGTIFELEPVARNYFMHAKSGTFFEFFPEKGELQIKETDNIYYLKK